MVGGTRASSVGDGVGAIEIGLAIGLKDATEERDVLSRSGKVVDSSVIDPESVTRLGRCWSRGNSTDTSNNYQGPGRGGPKVLSLGDIRRETVTADYGGCVCVLLLQDLLQSCSRGGRKRGHVL